MYPVVLLIYFISAVVILPASLALILLTHLKSVKFHFLVILLIHTNVVVWMSKMTRKLNLTDFTGVSKIAKNFVSVYLHGTTLLPLDGFPYNFMPEHSFKICQKSQVSLKSNKNDGYSTWPKTYIFDHISLNSTQNEKWFTKLCRETQNTHFMFNNLFSKIVPGRLQKTTWRMLVVYSIPKATNIKTDYVVIIAFPRQQ